MIRRSELHDVYTEAGRSVVMIREQVVVLSELATTILDAVPPRPSCVALDEIVHSVVAEFGPPPPPDNAATLTERHVHDLVAHGVLEIEDGLAHAAPSRDPGEATAALHRAMATVLAPDPGLSWTMPSDVSPDSFLAAVRRQRIGAQLATGLDRLDLPSQMRARLQADTDGMRRACLGLGRTLHRVIVVLEHEGVRALSFKGLALAAQAWGDEGARGYGDLDLLVAPADLPVAHRALVAAGWLHPLGYPTPGEEWGWRQFVRTNYEMPLMRGSTVLDLHWYPHPARNAFPSFDELWERRAVVTIDGHQVPTLSLYDALTQSASHSAKDHWRWLRGLADVHRLMSSRETWLQATRPLRHDQLLTVGVASRLFGAASWSPLVVAAATEDSGRAAALAIQGQIAPEHAPKAIRAAIAATFSPLARTRARPKEFVRHVGRLALPPHVLATNPSVDGWSAAPRALGRHVRGVTVRRNDEQTR